MRCDECGATEDVRVYPDDEDGDLQLCQRCADDAGFDPAEVYEEGDQLTEFDNNGYQTAADFAADDPYPEV